MTTRDTNHCSGPTRSQARDTNLCSGVRYHILCILGVLGKTLNCCLAKTQNWHYALLVPCHVKGRSELREVLDQHCYNSVQSLWLYRDTVGKGSRQIRTRLRQMGVPSTVVGDHTGTVRTWAQAHLIYKLAICRKSNSGIEPMV